MANEPQGEMVELDSGMPVFISRPQRQAAVDASVVLLHERYGLVQHTKELASRLAGFGYLVAAPNLFFEYPDQEALHRGEARLGRPPDDDMYRLICEAVDDLAAKRDADTGRLAMIGVCATGRYPILYGARRPLGAAVVFYGAAPKREWQVNESFPEALPSLVSRLEAPLLGIFGERDHGISVEDVRAFRDLLEENDKSYEITIYEGAPHGWLNDTMPGRYRAAAAKAAFEQLVGFLSRTFAEGAEPASSIEWRFSSKKSTSYDFSKNVRLE